MEGEDLENIKAKIISQTVESNFSFDNNNMLQLNIDNFVAELKGNEAAERRINDVVKRQSNNFFIKAVTELYPAAVKDYKSRTEQEFPFNGYGAALNYQVTYNDNCYLSTYRDNYQYTGGAHGTTLRKSDTFSLKTGNTVQVGTFFKGNYRNLILQNILKQAEKNMQNDPGIYFDDYKNLIVKYFNLNSFYLSPEGAVFYFGQYEIAPYAVGIVEFTVPYEIPPSC